VLAVHGHALDIGVPALAEIDLEILRCRAGQQIQVPFHVGRGEGFAVMPLTPLRSENVSVFPSSLHFQLSARSGTMPSRLFLPLVLVEHDKVVEHPPSSASTTEIVPSSWIDMLAGLSRWVMRRMPPLLLRPGGAKRNGNRQE